MKTPNAVTHQHDFKKGRSETTIVCSCGRFQNIGKPIIEKPDMSRKAWETYRKENLGGLSHSSVCVDYETWRENKMNTYCLQLEKSI